MDSPYGRLRFTLAVAGIAVLFLSWYALSDPPKPIPSLVRGCEDGQYWDDVDAKCVPGGEVTEIDGVPMEEIEKVLDAHRQELHAIKGVTASGIDRHGIRLEVDPDHDKIPDSIEGLPIHTTPSKVLIGN